MPLVYETGTTPPLLVPDPASAGANPNEFGTWFGQVTVPGLGGPTSTRSLKHCHTIYLDQSRGSIYVVDDGNRAVYCFDCATNPNNPTVGGGILVYDASMNSNRIAHDAQPVGDYLFVTVLGDGCWVYALPLDANAYLPARHAHYLPTPPQPSPPFQALVSHSTYLDMSTPSMQPTLVILSEDRTFADGRYGMAIHDFHQDVSGQFGQRVNLNFVEPLGIGTLFYSWSGALFPICSPAHHLRGVGRTGFIAHYLDGLSLVDLSVDPVSYPTTGWVGLRSLGTFDTSLGVHPWSSARGGPQPSAWATIWSAVDELSGCWDCYPYTDSGLVYASLGRTYIHDSFVEQVLTGGVFRVRQGHINRFWHATPFPPGVTGAGLFPKAVSQYGPPRLDNAFDLRDENADSYPVFDPVTQRQLKYRWTLCYSAQGPGPGAVNPASGGAPTWNPDPPGGWNPNPHPSPTPLWFNLQPHPGGNVAVPTNYEVIRNAVGVSTFHLTFPDGAQRVYCQILVEQLRVDPSGLVSTGNWAASRGSWFGVVP